MRITRGGLLKSSDAAGAFAPQGDLANLQDALATETTARAAFEGAVPLPPYPQSSVTNLTTDLAALQTRATALEAATLFARKAADATPVNASTTFASDTDLTMTVAASKTYDVEALLVYDASTAADLKVRFTGPTGATMIWALLALTSAATGSTGQIAPFAATAMATSLAAGGAGVGSIMFATIRGTLVTSTTAGTFALQWAQNTSDATNTTLRAGSFLHLKAVA